MAAQHGGVAGNLHVGHVEALSPPREPRIAELVVDDGQGLVPESRVDVLRPQRPALVQVLVRVDDDRHSPASSCPVWPMPDDDVRGTGHDTPGPRLGPRITVRSQARSRRRWSDHRDRGCRGVRRPKVWPRGPPSTSGGVRSCLVRRPVTGATDREKPWLHLSSSNWAIASMRIIVPRPTDGWPCAVDAESSPTGPRGTTPRVSENWCAARSGSTPRRASGGSQGRRKASTGKPRSRSLHVADPCRSRPIRILCIAAATNGKERRGQHARPCPTNWRVAGDHTVGPPTVPANVTGRPEGGRGSLLVLVRPR